MSNEARQGTRNRIWAADDFVRVVLSRRQLILLAVGSAAVIFGSFWGTLFLLRTFDTGAWASYTPSASCSSGSGSWGALTGRYRTVLGNTTFITIDATLTSAGTCAGGVQFGLPNTVANRGAQYFINGREIGRTGDLVAGEISATWTAVIVVAKPLAAAGAPIGDGYRYVLTGVYENQ